MHSSDRVRRVYHLHHHCTARTGRSELAREQFLAGPGYVGCGNSELSGCADMVRRTRKDAPYLGDRIAQGACKKIDSTKVTHQPGPSAQEFTRSGEENRARRSCCISRESGTGVTQAWSARRFWSRGSGTR
jgi:hypothetical protein